MPKKRKLQALLPIRTPRERPDALPCPNHNSPLDLPDLPLAKNQPGHWFPLLRLMRSEDGSGEACGLVFVDESYGLTVWQDRDKHSPPTWMDPEIFVRWAVTDEDVVQSIKRCLAAGEGAKRSAINEALQALLEEVYLPYLREQFEASRDLLARWLVAHFAVKAQDEEIKKSSRSGQKLRAVPK